MSRGQVVQDSDSACPLSPPPPRSTQATETFIKGCALHSGWKKPRRITLRAGEKTEQGPELPQGSRSPPAPEGIVSCVSSACEGHFFHRASLSPPWEAGPRSPALHPLSDSVGGIREEGTVLGNGVSVLLRREGLKAAPPTADRRGAPHGHPGAWPQPQGPSCRGLLGGQGGRPLGKLREHHRARSRAWSGRRPLCSSLPGGARDDVAGAMASPLPSSLLTEPSVSGSL